MRWMVVIVLAGWFILAGHQVRAGADDKPMIFRNQVAQYAVIVEDAQGMARCGLRSGAWAMQVYFTAAKAAAQVRDNLWPLGGDDAERSFKLAMKAFEVASDRGDAVPPAWCTRPGMSQYLGALDKLAGPVR
jgi:hypothetical protein